MVYAYTMRQSIPNYILYMFSGTLIYSFLANCINQSPTIMLNAEHYIKKTYVPKLVFVLISTFVEAMNFLFSFAALLVLGLLFGKLQFSWTFLVLPLLVFFGIFFAVGIQIVLSVLSVFFRDFVHVVPVLMQVAFFLTPILYMREMLPQRFQWLMTINPLNYFVEAFRAPLYHHRLPSADTLGSVFVISIVALAQGLILLRKYENKIIFKL